ncbi:MAG: peptidoglycan -binding protein [Rhodospirillales bacterium]|nr:peptidoglycan -binding protein [Rhodospirillales bacterium]
MTALSRRARRTVDIWPGFVDALSTLLMAFVFVLMVFVLAQFFLTEALSGRDQALSRLQGQMAELADILALERTTTQELSLDVARLSSELQASVAGRDAMRATLQAIGIKTEGLERELAGAQQTIVLDKARIEKSEAEASALLSQIATLRALREELERDIASKAQAIDQNQKALIAERELSESARAQVALLNRQIAAMRQQMAQIQELLDAKEKEAADQKIQVTTLGSRLNAALAGRVQELNRYRSEFFGRLREVLGDRPGIRIVGDRFVFQSEVLFGTGSAELGEGGREQMASLAATLRELAPMIPNDLNWVLEVDGHTDSVPISTAKYPSNWELSTDRAISVLKYLISEGISPNRLAAAGFGEFQPIEARDDEIARRRNRRIEIKLTQR